MLSTRGAKWATIDYAHGKKDRYDPVNNLDGVVDMGNAENVSANKAAKLINGR